MNRIEGSSVNEVVERAIRYGEEALRSGGLEADPGPMASLMTEVGDSLVAPLSAGLVRRITYLAALARELGVASAAASLIDQLADLGVPAEVQTGVLNLQGVLSAEAGDFERARTILEAARATGTDTSHPHHQAASVNLAVLHWRHGRLYDAVRAVPAVGGPDPGVRGLLAALKAGMARLGGESAAATSATHDLQAAVADLVEDQPAATLPLLANLASIKADQEYESGSPGRLTELTDTLDSLSQLVGATQRPGNPRSSVVRANRALAAFEDACAGGAPDRARNALDSLRDAVGGLVRERGANDPETLAAEANLATAWVEIARMEQSLDGMRSAVGELRTAYRHTSQLLGDGHRHSILLLNNLASAEFELASLVGAGYPEAADTLEKALAETTGAFGHGHPAARAAARQLRVCRRRIEGGSGFGSSGGSLMVMAPPREPEGFATDYVSFSDASRAPNRVSRASEGSRASRVDESAETEPRHIPGRADWVGKYALGLVFIDWIVGLVAAALALGLRFGDSDTVPFTIDYRLLTLLFPLPWLAVVAANRAYEARHLFVGTNEFVRVVRSGVGLVALLAGLSFVFDLGLARGYVIVAVLVATMLDVLARYLFRRLLHRSWARGDRLHRVILVGHAGAVAQMSRRLRNESHHGLGVVGACLPPATSGPVQGLPPVYGTFDQVAAAVAESGADTVVALSCPELDGDNLRRLAWQLERDEIDLIVASSLVDVAGDRATIRPIDGLPMLYVERPRLKGSSRMVKSAFDRIGALVLLVVLSPLLFVLAMVVRFDPRGRGPAIFRQERVGKDGQPFVLYKYRTMVINAEARLQELRNLNDSDGELFVMRRDPRITPVGAWIRRFSLDELPQLFNVLKGDMSLVGPRPPLAREVAGYPDDMRRRLVVKPGLTGLWQVSGRSDLSWEESIRLDVSYVENWSLAMDLSILARTFSAVIRGSGAY